MTSLLMLRPNMRKPYSLLSFLLVIVLFNQCKKHDSTPLSDAHEMASFVFRAGASNPVLKEDVYGVIQNDSIIARVPNGTNVTLLTPEIKFNGKSVNPASGATKDFTNPVQYSVLAENNTARIYTAVVKSIDTAKSIISFVFKAADNPVLTEDITVVTGQDTLYVYVPPGTAVQQLVPTITYKGKSLSPDSKVAQNFQKAVQYTVNAEDGTSRKYTVITGQNQFVYAGGSNGVLYALDATSGKIKWQYNAQSPVGNPVYHNGYVYVATSDGYMLAVNAITGALKWQTFMVKGAYGFPVAQDGYISVTCYNSVLYYLSYLFTLDETSGTLLWQKISSDPWGSPSIAQGIVIACGLSYGYHAFHAADGSDAYTIPMGVSRVNPVVVGNSFYLGGEYALLAECDIPTGTVKWKSVVGGATYSATVAQGVIFTPVGTVFANKTTDGTELWRSSLNSYFSPASYTNGVLISGAFTQPDVSGLDASTGKVIWTKKYTLNRASSFTAANGWVYFTLSDGSLQAIDAASGITQWTFQQPATSLSNLVVTDSKGNAFHVPDSGNQQ